MSTRATIQIVFDHLYESVGDRYGPCVYCGMPSEVLDHMPPLSWAAMCSEKAKQELKFFKLPACGECNGALGAMPLLSVKERRMYVRKWLRKRYKKALRVPYWDEDELKELSPTLCEEIRRANKQSALIKDRVTWVPPVKIDYLSCYEGYEND